MSSSLRWKVWVLLALCAWCVLRIFSRPFPQLDERVNFPEFLMCFRFADKPSNCGNFTVPFVTRNEFALAVSRQAREKVAAGHRPILLAIGSRSFSPDYEAYVPVLNYSQGVDYKLVLVEPDDYWDPQVEQAFTLWHKRFPGLCIIRERASIVRAAVSSTCETKNATFYRIARELAYRISDPEKAAWLRRSFGGSSLSRRWIEQDMHQNLGSDRIPNLTAYIDEVQVPCLSPRRLLMRLGLNPADIVMATVDAEGEDTPIVRDLLNISARPAHIFFEAGKHKKMLQPLQKEGYLVGMHCDAACRNLERPSNIAAVRKDYYWVEE